MSKLIIPITVKVNNDLHKRLKKVCQELYKSKAAFIRDCIVKELNKIEKE